MIKLLAAVGLFCASFSVTAFHAQEVSSSGHSFALNLTDRKDRPADYAVATLTPLFEGAVTGGVQQTADMMVQEDRLFAPFVLALQTGTELYFPNRDKIRHQVYSFSKAKKFELPLYGRETDNSETFPVAGVVPLGCNIHDNMLAYIHVHDAPIRGISGDNGLILFEGLRPGSYRLEVWHPDARRANNPVVQTVTIEGEAELALRLDIRRRRYQEPFEEEDY